MKAMLLAAGRGQRLSPLTLYTPKPLLHVGNEPLIERHLRALAASGFTEVVINHYWLGEQLEQVLGHGERFGLRIQWSRETEVLETGGGIYHALPLLGTDPFALINTDILTDYDFSQLRQSTLKAAAHLILVSNPPEHPHGDFALRNGQVYDFPELTYSGMAVLSPALFADCPGGNFRLADWLRKKMRTSNVTGEHYQGFWLDVGNPQRLNQANAMLKNGIKRTA